MQSILHLIIYKFTWVPKPKILVLGFLVLGFLENDIFEIRQYSVCQNVVTVQFFTHPVLITSNSSELPVACSVRRLRTV